jgi:hypothetical protein
MASDRTPVSSTTTGRRFTVGEMAKTVRITDRSIWNKGGMIIDSRNPQYLEHNTLQQHFVHDENLMDCPGI